LAAPQSRGDSGGSLTELVDAAAQRLQIAEPVAAFKWTTHGAIEDPGRVQQELAKLGADATREHIDPNYVTRVFGDQINATEAIEYSRFAGLVGVTVDDRRPQPDDADSDRGQLGPVAFAGVSPATGRREKRRHTFPPTRQPLSASPVVGDSVVLRLIIRFRRAGAGC
jgi:chorismate mutase-like protein